jgi:hypothetical protein
MRPGGGKAASAPVATSKSNGQAPISFDQEALIQTITERVMAALASK